MVPRDTHPLLVISIAVAEEHVVLGCVQDDWNVVLLTDEAPGRKLEEFREHSRWQYVVVRPTGSTDVFLQLYRAQPTGKHSQRGEPA